MNSALWTRCSLLFPRSAPLCWRSSACGLLPSFFLDRRKRSSGGIWLCRAVFPTPRAPSLCIAFAPTGWSRTVWDQRLGMLPVSALVPNVCGLGNGDAAECLWAWQWSDALTLEDGFPGDAGPWAEFGGTSSDPPAEEFLHYDALGIDDDDFG